MKTFKRTLNGKKFVSNDQIFTELPDEFTSKDLLKLKLLHNPHFKKGGNPTEPTRKWVEAGLIEVTKTSRPYTYRKIGKINTEQRETAPYPSKPDDVSINIISYESLSHNIKGVAEIGNVRITGTFTMEVIKE